MHSMPHPATAYRLEPLIDYARECLRHTARSSKSGRNFIFRDRFTHSMRVKGWCERLMTKVPADPGAVLAAAVLHDIGYAVSADDHAVHGAKMAKDFLLKAEYPIDFISDVSDLVLHHSNKAMDCHGMSNELIVLQDADCLDELGALTVFWDAMAEGQLDEQNYMKTYERVSLSYERLRQRNRKLKSEYGQFLYRQRLETLSRFIQQIEYELFL